MAKYLSGFAWLTIWLTAHLTKCLSALLPKRFTPLLTVCLAGFFSLSAYPLWAEALRDPTLPPVQSGLVSAERLPTVTPVPVLQSITLGSATQFAMINGQTVPVGGTYADWVLIRLSANEAILRGKDGKTKTLVMDYAIQKQRVTLQPDKQAARKTAAALATDITRAAEITRKNNLTERQPAPVRVQTESLWVKQ